MLVLDTSVLARLYSDTVDKPIVESIINQASKKKQPILFPNLIWFELPSALFRTSGDVSDVNFNVEHFKLSVKQGWFFVSPFSYPLLKKAIAMAGTDTKSQGHISVYDAYFHCLAIENGGTFITADKRHYRLTKERFGHIELVWDREG